VLVSAKNAQPAPIFNRYVLKVDNAKLTFFLDSDF